MSPGDLWRYRSGYIITIIIEDYIQNRDVDSKLRCRFEIEKKIRNQGVDSK